jgi:aspartyl-tRNA(Asn)/glutamyl-tRNA(Gln) amidotransferase subunit B
LSEAEGSTKPMTYTIDGNTGTWEIVCGLEVHAQVTSNAKLFSGASTAFGAEPNSQVSPVDAGMPGMLPVLNGHCVAQAVKTGLGLEAHINRVSIFERKNYFYPDLPNGYQISQYEHPIVGHGKLLIDFSTAAPSPSASPASISRWTPASRCTTSARARP